MTKRGTEIEDNDLGWKMVVRSITEFDGKQIKIGIQSDEKDENGITVVEYAFYNEFGTEDIPARPFIKSTMDEQRHFVNKLIDKVAGSVIDRVMPARQALGVVGQYVEDKVKAKIREIKTPPNAPSTIAQKGSSNPLIDTGRMLNSVIYVIEGI